MPSTQTDRLNGLTTSVAIKPPCKAVTTTSITQTGEQTIGGVACETNDRYLYAITAGSVLNGIWVVSTGAHTRATDWDGTRDVVTGTMVLVKPGTADEQFWIVTTTTDPIVPGTTSITLAQHTPEELALRGDLADSSDVADGDALIAVKRTETNAVARTLHFYVQHSKLLVANYCDPTADSAATVAAKIALAITDAKANGKALEFEAGATYTSNATFAFLGTASLRGLRFWGNGCTLVCNTGAVPVATLDAGSTTDRCDDIEFMDFVLKGQASATYGLYARGMSRSRMRARAVDVATAGFYTAWSVLSDHHFTVSNNIDTFAVNPATGLIVERSSAGLYCAANKYHVVMEGPISILGVDLVYAGLGNIFTGSCENIPRGLRQRSTANDGVLFYMDFEGNSVYDLLIEGRGLEIVGGECSSSGSGETIALASTATDVSFVGGFRRSIDIDASATGVTINDVAVSDNVVLGIKGTGVDNWRGTGNVEVDTNRAITATISDQTGAVGSFTATLTGCTTSPTGSVTYRRNGDAVTLTIPAITGTSNTTAATLTGMPTAIRPAATRACLGITTDNGTSQVGKIEIASSGVMTLHVALSATFTGSGTKGVQVCSVTYNA